MNVLARGWRFKRIAAKQKKRVSIEEADYASDCIHPKRVRRIQAALAMLDDPPLSLMLWDVTVDDGGSVQSGRSSQDFAHMARPTIRIAQRQSGLTVMKQQMAKVEAMY